MKRLTTIVEKKDIRLAEVKSMVVTFTQLNTTHWKIPYSEWRTLPWTCKHLLTRDIPGASSSWTYEFSGGIISNKRMVENPTEPVHRLIYIESKDQHSIGSLLTVLANLCDYIILNISSNGMVIQLRVLESVEPEPEYDIDGG